MRARRAVRRLAPKKKITRIVEVNGEREIVERQVVDGPLKPWARAMAKTPKTPEGAACLQWLRNKGLA